MGEHCGSCTSSGNERCQICVDPQCGGKKNCDCNNCDKRETCYRVLRPTIKITQKCTQQCKHCCFACTPESNIADMSLDTARKVNAFLRSNNIRYANVMGGEFFCHPQWQEVLGILSDDVEDIRIPTNSDWAGENQLSAEVIGFLKSHPNVRFSLSKDRWHTNAHVDKAQRLLDEAGILYNIATEEQTKEDSLVPLGRSMYESYNYYATWGCYCYKPDSRYTFMVAEDGTIFKCVFGMWDYAHVDDFTEGGFAARFKEYNDRFYGVFIANCMSCSRACPSERRLQLKLRTAA